MYHSVATSERRAMQDAAMAMPAETFAAQMSFLSKRRCVISLDTLNEMLTKGESAAPGSIVITFDDGYLDNYEIAAPILAEHGLPATVFLATGYIERVENMWIDVLYGAFRNRTQQRLELPDGNFDLTQPLQVDYGYQSVAGTLVRASKVERAELMSLVQAQLKPAHDEPRLTMSWSEVRNLRQRFPNISIGAHTREHVDLSGMPDDEVVEELSAAHEDIRREVGVDAIHFTFPYGHDNAHARAWLKSNGYRTALLTEPTSLVRNNSDPMALTRLEVTQDQSLGRFAYHTSGAHPSLSRALFLGRA
jgi:peptidoglycan/xylan/chitin deacetylase (PgdA/CDA1 family)